MPADTATLPPSPPAPLPAVTRARPDGTAAASGLVAGLLVVFRRELGALFDSSIAYVYGAVFLALSGAIFMNDFFLAGVVDMSSYFQNLPYLLALFIPAITMRAWSEERAAGTIELLLTLPLRASQLVAGKYLAGLAFTLVVLAGSFPIVWMLRALGQPDLGLIAASYLGAALLGALFLAVGLFISGLTREQIVAFVVSTFACALLVLVGERAVVEVVDGLAPERQLGTLLSESLSVLPRYEAFCRGVVSLGDAAYFVVLTAAGLLLNVASVRARPGRDS